MITCRFLLAFVVVLAHAPLLSLPAGAQSPSTGDSPGDEVPVIAVMDLTGNNVPVAEARALTDRLRSELFETQRFTVLERARMEEILREQGFQIAGYCDETVCLAEAGKLLPVESMVGGSVSRVGDVYSVSLRMVHVESGRVTRTATEDCPCPIGDVLTRSMGRAAARLAGVSEAPAAPPGPERAAPAERGLQGKPDAAERRRPLIRLGIGAGGARTNADDAGWDLHDGVWSAVMVQADWRIRSRWQPLVRVARHHWSTDGGYGPRSLNVTSLGFGAAYHAGRAKKLHPYIEFGLELEHLERGSLGPAPGAVEATTNCAGVCLGPGLSLRWGEGRDVRLEVRLRSFEVRDEDFLVHANRAQFTNSTLGLSVGF